MCAFTAIVLSLTLCVVWHVRVINWPERILKLHLDAQVAVCPVLTLHWHPEHPRITAAGGEGKDGEELEQEEESHKTWSENIL